MKKVNYEQLLKRINQDYKITMLLKLYCHFATVLTVVVFLTILIFSIEDSITKTVGFLVTLGAPFLLVSLLRKLINAPRPYEIYGVYTVPPKKKQGDSFPSRHAFSIFAIGTLCLFVEPIVGIITLALVLIMCACRVLLGIHFTRDVVTGALIGIITSLIGAFILYK